MIRTKDKPLLNYYAQPDQQPREIQEEIDLSKEPKLRRQSSSKKIFNSNSKSGSFLGDNLVEDTFFSKTSPSEVKPAKQLASKDAQKIKEVQKAEQNIKKLTSEKHRRIQEAPFEEKNQVKRDGAQKLKQDINQLPERSASKEVSKTSDAPKRWERLYNLSRKKEVEIGMSTKISQGTENPRYVAIPQSKNMIRKSQSLQRKSRQSDELENDLQKFTLPKKPNIAEEKSDNLQHPQKKSRVPGSLPGSLSNTPKKGSHGFQKPTSISVQEQEYRKDKNTKNLQAKKSAKKADSFLPYLQQKKKESTEDNQDNTSKSPIKPVVVKRDQK